MYWRTGRVLPHIGQGEMARMCGPGLTRPVDPRELGAALTPLLSQGSPVVLVC